MRYESKTGCSGPRRTLNIFNETPKPISLGKADPHWSIKNLFGYFGHTVKKSATAGENNSA
jgi:hypothetical protein